MTHTALDRRDNGSMLLAMGFTMVIVFICSAIFAAVLTSTSSTRTAINRATARMELANAVGWLQREWYTIPIIRNGVVNSDNCFTQQMGQKYNSSGGTFKLDRATWEFCFQIDQRPGEGYFEGVTITGRVQTPEKTRYYKAHATGVPGEYGNPTNIYAETLNPLDNIFAGGLGFAARDSILAGGTGSTFSTYSSASATTSAGVPMVAADYQLGTANAGVTQLTRNTINQFDGGSCAGPGCAGTVLARRWWALDESPKNYIPAGCSANSLDWPDWRSSTAPTPGVLASPAEGACYNNVIFDRDTSITGNVRLYVRNGVFVSSGVKVNVPNSTPDARKLRISRATSITPNVLAYNMLSEDLTVEANGQIAAQIALWAGACNLATGSTYYGSLWCDHGINAVRANLRYQSELSTAANYSTPGASTNDREINLFVNDWNSVKFKEVSKSEAGY